MRIQAHEFKYSTTNAEVQVHEYTGAFKHYTCIVKCRITSTQVQVHEFISTYIRAKEIPGTFAYKFATTRFLQRP